MLQVAALILIAIPSFFLTRAVAKNNQHTALRNAAEWYRRGQEHMQAGRLDSAMEAFRRASLGNRTNKTYVLALARTLALKGDYESARAAVLSLRESAPEDIDINVQLARLAVARKDTEEALRYYDATLYAPWPLERAAERRKARFELVRFLISQNQLRRAQSELLASTADLPDDVALRREVAELFASAGDEQGALRQLQHVIRLAPDDEQALAEAAQAAFRLGQYALAQQYLRRTTEGSPELQRIRAIVDLLLSRDPLTPRLGSSERRRRLLADMSDADERFSACYAERLASSPSSDDVALQSGLHAFEGAVRRRAALDQDVIEAGIDLATRAVRRSVQVCGPATINDEVLLRIGRRHGAEPR